MTTNMATKYDADFFKENVEGSLRSARVVVPLVLELTKAKSVVDFGCGMGTWLRAFGENGVDEVLGLDGPYVDRSRFEVDPSRFRESDLSKPIKVDRTYDLATCLEVGEHLPTRSSRDLIDSLAAAAPIVLFSAAVPGQGGTDHRNEQWPGFWEKLFSRAGMSQVDVIRPRIFGNLDVEWWYRQNVFLYAKDPRSLLSSSEGPGQRLDIIFPSIFYRYKSLPGLCRETARAAVRGVRNRLARRGWDRSP